MNKICYIKMAVCMHVCMYLKIQTWHRAGGTKFPLIITTKTWIL